MKSASVGVSEANIKIRLSWLCQDWKTPPDPSGHPPHKGEGEFRACSLIQFLSPSKHRQLLVFAHFRFNIHLFQWHLYFRT